MSTAPTGFGLLTCRGCIRAIFSISAVLWTANVLAARPGDSKADEKGFVFREDFQGTSDTLGTFTRLDTRVGYRFSKHFEVDAGLPLYLVHASASSTAAGSDSANGIGNAYLSLRFGFSNSLTSFVSSLTGSAPTGDTAKGLSTGRVTVDWNNYLGITAGRITPFVNAGLASSISDTPFFTRPFTSLGKVAHFEIGADVQAWRALSVGGSAYEDAPFGQQKVYSKLIRRGQAAGSGRGRGRGPKSGVFETQSVTVGGAGIARDSGGSAWLSVNPGRVVEFQAGISRSTEYDLNSVFFGVVIDLGNWIRGDH